MKTNQLFKMLPAFLVVITFGLYSCNNENDSAINGEGQFRLNITDAPIDEEGITGVFVTFTGIEYQKDDGPWVRAEEFEGPITINLLELQNGRTTLMGDFSAGSGNYTGLRFMLDAPSLGRDGSNPGCFVEFEDGRRVPLFVPSGAQTGYKAKGTFSVPVNGNVEITADFDLRKSVTRAGNSGRYILKPTIRIIANNESGTIQGTISNRQAETGYVVFLYETGTYSESESADPAEGESRFPNAVSSTAVEANGDFRLAFIGAKTYDLVIAAVDSKGIPTVIKIVPEVMVKSREITSITIALN